MLHLPTRLPVTACLPLTAVLFFGACGGGTVQEQRTQRTSAALSLSAPDSSFKVWGTHYAQVPKTELQCAIADFAAHVQLGDTATHAPFDVRTGGINVQVSALLALLDSLAVCPVSGPIERAVIVHYGLNDSDAFDVRLQLRCLSYDELEETYTYAASNDCYLVKPDGDLSFIPNGLLAWRDSTGGWTNYRKNVVVQSDTDGPWATLDLLREPNAMVHGEDDIRALIKDNELEEGFLSIVPIAEPEQRTRIDDKDHAEEGFHQGVAWIPVGVELDDEKYEDRPFHAKACDLGSPCPPGCPTAPFIFHRSGTPPRAECE
ncbi:MAG: hypothetical protein JNM62_05395 [Flavobacteriales bacterium]|nr:hypothetical protein [Flavobacteriales bacterium]